MAQPEPMETDLVKLKTMDDQIFEVPRDIAEMSAQVKNMLDGTYGAPLRVCVCLTNHEYSDPTFPPLPAVVVTPAPQTLVTWI